MPLNPTHILIHHSFTEDSITVSWDAIRRYHTEKMGWKDIGYHYGLELVGDHVEIFTGRMLTETGAHCKEGDMNNVSIGICCVGNYDYHEPLPQMMDMLVKLVKMLMAVFHVPAVNVRMHREYATYKSCPGKMFPWENFKERLKNA